MDGTSIALFATLFVVTGYATSVATLNYVAPPVDEAFVDDALKKKTHNSLQSVQVREPPVFVSARALSNKR